MRVVFVYVWKCSHDVHQYLRQIPFFYYYWMCFFFKGWLNVLNNWLIGWNDLLVSRLVGWFLLGWWVFAFLFSLFSFSSFLLCFSTFFSVNIVLFIQKERRKNSVLFMVMSFITSPHIFYEQKNFQFKKFLFFFHYKIGKISNQKKKNSRRKKIHEEKRKKENIYYFH